MNRAEVLEAAKKCVCGQREQDYGSPENNFETIGELWGIYLTAAHPNWTMPVNGITAKDVAVLMALLKVARIASGSSEDSFVDLAGYAACAGEIATRAKGVTYCGKCVNWEPGTGTTVDPEGRTVRTGVCSKNKELTSATNGCGDGDPK